MISATITNISVVDGNIFVDYRLLNDLALDWSHIGRFAIDESATQDSIKQAVVLIVDKWNFAESLQPIVSSKIVTVKPVPSPVIPATPIEPEK